MELRDARLRIAKYSLVRGQARVDAQREQVMEVQEDGTQVANFTAYHARVLAEIEECANSIGPYVV